MKKYDQYCLIFSILALVPVALLVYSFFPNSFLYNEDSAVITLGLLSFGLVLAAFYFAIPYFDDETSEKRPFTPKFGWGIGIGSVALFLAVIFTPLVFLAWSTNGLKNIIAFIS